VSWLRGYKLDAVYVTTSLWQPPNAYYLGIIFPHAGSLPGAVHQ